MGSMRAGDQVQTQAGDNDPVGVSLLAIGTVSGKRSGDPGWLSVGEVQALEDALEFVGIGVADDQSALAGGLVLDADPGA
jgi:hypothetical protein